MTIDSFPSIETLTIKKAPRFRGTFFMQYFKFSLSGFCKEKIPDNNQSEK